MLEFKEIPTLPGYYVSQDGQVASMRRGFFQLKTPVKNHHGYLGVSTSIEGKAGLKTIHRAVAEVYLPRVEGKPYVNHMNGDQLDNRMENLEWVNNSENLLHATRVLGRRTGGKKLIPYEDKILELNSAGMKQQDIADIFNVHQSTISYLLKRRGVR